MKGAFSFLNSYKQQNFFLWGGALIFLCLIYTTSIRKTLKYKADYQNNLTNVQRAATAKQDIQHYQQIIEELQESSLKAYDQEYLLSAITAFCKANNLLVRTFPEAQKVELSAYTIVTNGLEVEGTYKDIVSLIYQIEQIEKLAALSSAHFFLHKDRISRKQSLRCKMVLRNLE